MCTEYASGHAKAAGFFAPLFIYIFTTTAYIHTYIRGRPLEGATGSVALWVREATASPSLSVTPHAY